MKILLVCYGGLSTSMLVNEMKKAVSESIKLKDKKIEIEASGKEDYMNKLEGVKAILLGPQVAIIKEEVKNIVANKGLKIPVEVIDKNAYGAMDGNAVLVETFKLIRAAKEEGSSNG